MWRVPMKSLLAQEMSMPNGSKGRSPSIIARLMGLDVLPPHSSPHRELKSMENQQRRPLTSEKARGKKTYDGHKSLRRGSMEEQRFKDVFEVLEAEKEKSSKSLCSNADLTEAEMAFIRHNFMEAKRLSTDEKLRYSKEFDETLDTLDSNKDLLLNFLHHPDSLFTKHGHHLQSIAPKPHCSHASTLKLSNSSNRVDSFKTLKKRSGLKPTEIVVLKPNPGKPQTMGTTLPPQSSSCDEVGADRRLRDSKAFGSLRVNEDASLLRHKPIDSLAIARIVSRQMKASCSNYSEVSRFRGYARDESSSGSDSSSESKLMSVISRARTDFNRKNHRRSLPSRSPESSVSKEAMRRLSERWKVAHKSEQEIESSRRNTLAEMLSTSDRDARPASFNGLSKRIKSNVGPDPIGISSRDGWKSSGKRRVSKVKTIMHQDRSYGHTIVLPKNLTTRDGLVKGNREFFLSNNSTPVSIYSHSSSESNNISSSRKNLDMDAELSKEKLRVLKTQSRLSAHTNSATENGSDYEDAKTTPSLEPPDLSAVTSLTDPDISGREIEEVDLSSIPQLQHEESAKEGDQPSPVSILQTAFHDEFSSSSDCFESLSADLQGLRMQLQLLKLESGDYYNEGAMLVSSDENAYQEESSIVTDDSLTTPELSEDWKSLYLADVLSNSRFSDLNPESFVATWHSSESPVDPSLFEDLEKKYSGLNSSTWLERKFLFDWINSEILKLFEQSKVFPKCDRNLIQETLCGLVTIQYVKPSRETEEKEFHWWNSGDDIEVMIRKEIEEMLTDELIAELVIGEIW